MESITDPQCSGVRRESGARTRGVRSAWFWFLGKACSVSYYAMFPIFVLGALLFYVVMRCHLLFVVLGRAPEVSRLYIHHGARLFFWILKRINVADVKTDLTGSTVGASVVVANHPSMLDAMLLLSALPNAVCVMKPSLLRLPIIGGFARRARYIPQAEPPELLSAAKQALVSGASIVVFPEGTRSAEEGMGDFKRGAARLALEARCPIVPVGILMEPVVLGRDWPFESPPNARIHYKAVRLAVSGAAYTPPENGLGDDLRAESIRLTRYLEDRIKNSLL